VAGSINFKVILKECLQDFDSLPPGYDHRMINLKPLPMNCAVDHDINKIYVLYVSIVIRTFMAIAKNYWTNKNIKKKMTLMT
jgi:hypothetical protein